MQIDLQALLGSVDGPMPMPAGGSPPSNQPLQPTSATFNWAVPNDTQVLQGMEGFDTFLMDCLNDQAVDLDQSTGTNLWDDLIKTMT